jgi:hypothetical protein
MIFPTGAGIPVKARTPPDGLVPPEEVTPDELPPVPVDPADDGSPAPPAPVVVVVDGPPVAVVVVAPPAVVVAVVPPAPVVVVVAPDPVVVVDEPLGGPGTADQTNPLGSGVLFVKVISVFQLSVSTPAPVTQAMPPSQTPLVPPGPSSRAERMLKLVTPGPHSRSLGRVGTTSLEATGMLSMGAAVLSRKPYPVEMVLLAKVRPWMFVPWGTR